MLKLRLIFIILISTIFVANSAYALQFDEPITASALVTKDNLTNSLPQIKKVYLMNIKLTPQQKKLFLTYHSTKTNVVNSSLPKKVYIGMNDVPVLDQGMHGSCVTFANTAAIDALLGKGDYVSQLCNLALGSYFSERGGESGWPLSGWNGAMGPLILDRIESFGFVNKTNQKAKGCGGLLDYPRDNKGTGNAMSLDDFHGMPNEEIIEDLFWDSLLTFTQRMGFNPSEPTSYDGDKLLFEVKQFLANTALTSKDKIQGIVTFGIMLPADYCFVGACASYHKSNDTWAVTTPMLKIDPVKDKFTLAGHEMIIIGYDDDATVTDNEGKEHRGLLFVRNSWGTEVGDNGNFYITYEFFKKFVDEVQLLYKPSL